ncbi:MAG: type II toxin-antitoxin system death-on-curing family toxin [Planctomycetota bacterium]
MSAIRFLTWDEVLDIHRRALEAHGGQDGIRDLGSLESALATSTATFGGEFLHEDVAAMAAAYLFHISESQGFLDGNKRTGVAACLIFLKLNGYECTLSDNDLYDVTIGFANHTADKSRATAMIRPNLAKTADPTDRPGSDA